MNASDVNYAEVIKFPNGQKNEFVDNNPNVTTPAVANAEIKSGTQALRNAAYGSETTPKDSKQS